MFTSFRSASPLVIHQSPNLLFILGSRWSSAEGSTEGRDGGEEEGRIGGFVEFVVDAGEAAVDLSSDARDLGTEGRSIVFEHSLLKGLEMVVRGEEID